MLPEYEIEDKNIASHTTKKETTRRILRWLESDIRRKRPVFGALVGP